MSVLIAGIPRALIHELDEIAHRHERSRSAEIRLLISRHIEREREKVGV